MRLTKIGFHWLLCLLFVGSMRLNAEDAEELEALRKTFARMRGETRWDWGGNLHWGFFFVDPEKGKLDALARHLEEQGFTVVSQHTSEDKQHWLQVARIEHHTPKSLHARNLAFEDLAEKFKVSAYDGWDVGPVARDAHVRKWWVYLADYDGLPGTVRVDLSLRKRSPMGDLPNLIKISVRYKEHAERDGLPDDSELQALYKLTDKMLEVIHERINGLEVGTFVHKGKFSWYVYAGDVSSAREELEEFFEENDSEREHSIAIKEDKEWKAYLEFLFPNQPTIDFYRDELEKIGALEFVE